MQLNSCTHFLPLLSVTWFSMQVQVVRHILRGASPEMRDAFLWSPARRGYLDLPTLSMRRAFSPPRGFHLICPFADVFHVDGLQLRRLQRSGVPRSPVERTLPSYCAVVFVLVHFMIRLNRRMCCRRLVLAFSLRLRLQGQNQTY